MEVIAHRVGGEDHSIAELNSPGNFHWIIRDGVGERQPRASALRCWARVSDPAHAATEGLKKCPLLGAGL